MKRKATKPVRLRDMNQERALARCATITADVWGNLNDGDTIELWRVFRAYILNGYKDTGATVPSRIADVWERCKTIIDGEVAK